MSVEQETRDRAMNNGMKRLPIPIEMLRATLVYNPDTGLFLRNGRLAGNRSRDGYVRIRVGRLSYKAHRLAWAYMLGVQPPRHMDHINGDGMDNRWANLRECSVSENQQNARRRKDSTTGFTGVWRSGEKYVAAIRKDGRRHHLGYRDSPEEAYELYLAAKRQMHPFQPEPRAKHPEGERGG